MKKKFLLILLILSVFTASIFTMVACGNNKVYFEMPANPDGVSSLTVYEESRTVYDGGEKGPYFHKGQKIFVSIQISDEYSIGTLKVYINNVELAFTLVSAVENRYESALAVVEDEIVITFSGEAIKNPLEE